MSFTHQNVLDYKKRFEGCEYVELSCEEFDVLLTAAERSIRRPIADAPMNTPIDVFGESGYRYPGAVWDGVAKLWEVPGKNGQPTLMIIEPVVSWLPIPGEGGV
jgi:hypothetical protein